MGASRFDVREAPRLSRRPQTVKAVCLSVQRPGHGANAAPRGLAAFGRRLGKPPFPSTARFLKTMVRTNCRPAGRPIRSVRPFFASRPVPLLPVAWPRRSNAAKRVLLSFSAPNPTPPRRSHHLLLAPFSSYSCDVRRPWCRESQQLLVSHLPGGNLGLRKPRATPCDVAAVQVDRAMRRSDDSTYGQQRGAFGTPAPTLAALRRTRTSAAFVRSVLTIHLTAK